MASGPFPEQRFAAAFAAVDTSVYLFGGSLEDYENPGSNEATHLDDLHILDTVTGRWETPSTTGRAPSKRRWHSLTAVGNKLYLFGGELHENQLKDLYVLNTNKMRWQRLKTKRNPSPRCAHSATAIGDSIYIFGGFSKGTQFRSMYIYSTTTNSWSKPKNVSGPSPRSNHTAVPFGRFIFIFGGYDMANNALLSDMWRYDTKHQRWKEIEVDLDSPTPPARCNHSAAAVGNKMILYGGRADRVKLEDMWFYDVKKNSWKNPTSIHCSGDGHVMIVDERLYVFGGSASFRMPGRVREYEQQHGPLRPGHNTGSSSGGTVSEESSFGPGHYGRGGGRYRTYRSERTRYSYSSSGSRCEQVFPQEENLEMLGYNFAFLSQIARGRDTVVYDAVEKTNGRRVAVKIFDTYKDYKHPPKEARLLQEVTGHPYIQNYIMWYPLKYTRCYALVTDYHENDRFKPAKEKLSGIRKYMRCLLEALDHCHSNSIIHRDVKISNICWSAQTKQAVLIDFDVATSWNASNPKRSMCGTDPYMAPEVVQKGVPKRYRKSYSFPVDVWSSGIVFAELLFNEDLDDVPTIKQVNKFVDRATRKNGGRTLVEHDLLKRMLRTNPNKRITCAKALRHPFFTDMSSGENSGSCSTESGGGSLSGVSSRGSSPSSSYSSH